MHLSYYLGNNGERGCLIVTNLRIIWVSHAHNRINLSETPLHLPLLYSYAYGSIMRIYIYIYIYGRHWFGHHYHAVHSQGEE
jgi:hypothetical protein